MKSGPVATILVIEPNPDIRENTCELLELDGFEVLVADSGVSGLALAKEKLPDVIICDVVMRDMDGISVARELCRDQQLSLIPVIFLDTSARTKEIEPDLAPCVVGYIRKPFTAEELIECISNCFQTKQG